VSAPHFSSAAEVIFIMASHKAGRPVKPDQKKRQQLHISLYAEDLERLDRLTDNRSEFLRQCIAKAWEEQVEGEAMLSVTLPKSLVRQLRKIVEQIEPRHHVPSYRTLVARFKE
jgi:hypothetical protein